MMSDGTPTTSAWSRPGGPWASGTVTGSGVLPGPPPVLPPPPGEPGGDGPRRRRRQMLIFGGVAGGILAIGLVIILIVALSSDGDAFSSKASAPTDVRPPLAQMCPAPTTIPKDEPTPDPQQVPPATGEQTVDKEAGISYRKFGAPWLPWTTVWRAGTLEVPYKVGQHFVTETYNRGSYHASILSAAVPAAENDAVVLNLDCVGRQIAADVRAEYYPQPNTIEQLQDKMTTLGGRPAYLSEFRLHFHSPGLTATAERSAVAVIDVGKPTAAVLYISIPNTHVRYDGVIAEVLASVRPL